MNRGLLLALVGLMLMGVGFRERGWWALLCWLGGDFLALGIAHCLGAHRLFGKHPEGSIPIWSRLVFLPLLLCTEGVWQLLCLISLEPAKNRVTDQLSVGRRLSASEVDEPFDNYVDLTAEFSEPGPVRRLAGYLNFPILDGAAPEPNALAAAIQRLRPGRTYVHCAQGHGRAGLFALALLLKSGAARDVQDGLRILQAARPGIDLNRTQQRGIASFARLHCSRSESLEPA